MARDYRPSLVSIADLVEDPGKISRWLYRAPATAFIAFAVFAAFGTYFCTYAFRRPFAAGLYAGVTQVPLLGVVDTKIVLIVSQLAGYATSKLLGIKFVSEMPAARRAVAIGAAIGVAELALLLFAVVPASLRPLCLFLNGLPLGMVWGLVFGYLEGRRVSDVLGAAVSASFILASGIVKAVGQVVIDWGVTENWMPFATGLLFVLPTAVFVWLLAQIPPPTGMDEAERLHRAPMNGAQRWEFFAGLAPGLVLLTFAYVLMTAYRDFRDNFAREIWDALGYADVPSILTTSEIPVAIGALLAVGAVTVVRDNHRAVLVVHALLVFGAGLIGTSTLLFELGLLDPAWWMILVGLGLYLGYVPYNCVLFDRLIPAVGVIGTATFMIYVTHAFGYLGSVGLMLYRSVGHPDLSWLDFFVAFSWVTAAATIVVFVLSAIYFSSRARRARLAVSLDGGL